MADLRERMISAIWRTPTSYNAVKKLVDNEILPEVQLQKTAALIHRENKAKDHVFTICRDGYSTNPSGGVVLCCLCGWTAEFPLTVFLDDLVEARGTHLNEQLAAWFCGNVGCPTIGPHEHVGGIGQAHYV